MATIDVTVRETLHRNGRKYASLALGISILIGLVSLYLFPAASRTEITNTLRTYRGGSIGGLAMGYYSSIFLTVAQFYTVAKRSGNPAILKRLGGGRLWLNIHIALSSLGVAAGAIHSGFPYRFPWDHLTSAAYGILTMWLMLAIALSGVFGRYLYTRLPAMKAVFRHWKTAHLIATVLLLMFGVAHLLIAGG